MHPFICVPMYRAVDGISYGECSGNVLRFFFNIDRLVNYFKVC